MKKEGIKLSLPPAQKTDKEIRYAKIEKNLFLSLFQTFSYSQIFSQKKHLTKDALLRQTASAFFRFYED